MTKRPTAIIAEDEGPQRQELRAILAQSWPELEIVAECADGLEALEALHALRPDIAFLDIRMPGVSGIEVAREACTIAHVVFITAYEEFALNAFERDAVDYLVKPVKRERLETTISRLQARLAAGQRADLAALLRGLRDRVLPDERHISWVSASVGDTIKMISIDDVLFFQSEDKYTRVVAKADSAHIRTPLKDLISRLDPETFWQVHRSAIVRVAAIKSIKRDEGGRLRLSIAGKTETIPVSPAFQHRFKAM